ncbi:MAG: YciI family protein [Thermomicrobiales bacterium]
MLIIAQDPDVPMSTPGTPDFDEMMARWSAFNQMLLEGDHWLGGGSLQPVSTATTVRKASGATPLVSDGPFAETKEVIAGFYLITAADLDEALTLAKQVPVDRGSVEVRPILYRPNPLA